MSVGKRRGVAGVGVCGVVAGCALFVAPMASAAESAPLSKPVTDVIASENLTVETVHGIEAVAGRAARVDEVRAAATSQGFGTVTLYTGNDETGQAILIFTGNDNSTTPPDDFHIGGGTITSVADDTDQAWYVFNDNGTLDASVAPETARNIPPVDAGLGDSYIYSAETADNWFYFEAN